MRYTARATSIEIAFSLKEPIGVVAALFPETRDLRRRLRPLRCLSAGGLPLMIGGAAGREVLLGHSGMGPSCAAELAERLIRERPIEALLSVGFAGGLEPGLQIGDLVLADRVCFKRLLTCDARLLRHGEGAVQDLGLRYRRGLLISKEKMVGSSEGKRDLFVQEGAAAVDMESGAVAEVAARARVPFLAIRSISDLSEQALDPWIGGLIGPGGGIGYHRLFSGLLRRPDRLGLLWRLRQQSFRAAATLNEFLIRFLTTL